MNKEPVSPEGGFRVPALFLSPWKKWLFVPAHLGTQGHASSSSPPACVVGWLHLLARHDPCRKLTWGAASSPGQSSGGVLWFQSADGSVHGWGQVGPWPRTSEASAGSELPPGTQWGVSCNSGKGGDSCQPMAQTRGAVRERPSSVPPSHAETCPRAHGLNCGS